MEKLKCFIFQHLQYNCFRWNRYSLIYKKWYFSWSSKVRNFPDSWKLPEKAVSCFALLFLVSFFLPLFSVLFKVYNWFTFSLVNEAKMLGEETFSLIVSVAEQKVTINSKRTNVSWVKKYINFYTAHFKIYSSRKNAFYFNQIFPLARFWFLIVHIHNLNTGSSFDKYILALVVFLLLRCINSAETCLNLRHYERLSSFQTVSPIQFQIFNCAVYLISLSLQELILMLMAFPFIAILNCKSVSFF